MDKLVEEVGRALCPEYDRLPECATYMHRKTYPGRHWMDRQEVREDARAAIAAMPQCDALAQIARGDVNGGSPLGGEKARQLARGAMIELGLDW